ncbi:Hypp1732 [Branchiostoma lanceolatum]|uniref:Hypp1732 protein n=1 Tax=Branchiostoma lanceolatum TaxID=7740 RepID=A0A8J9ZMM9_BRALA|nr:Hypp1732 [Branchiostoma lanceolatum]
MSNTEDKKHLPPYAGPPADPEADFKDLAAHQKKLKTGLVAGAVFLVLLVTGATLLGVFLSRDANNKLTANRKLKYDGNVIQEKIEVDVELKTEAFYTKSEDGETAVMFDTKNDLTAYKFSGLHICFVVEGSASNEDAVEKLANEIDKDDEDKVEEAEAGEGLNLTLDGSRGQVDKSILNENMLDFCKSREVYWAITREVAPASDNAPAAADDGAKSRKKRLSCREYYRCRCLYYYWWGGWRRCYFSCRYWPCLGHWPSIYGK